MTIAPDTNPLAGLSIVTALANGIQVPIPCPTRFCITDHTGEDTRYVEDIDHSGEHIDLYVPDSHNKDALFAFAHLAQDVYSTNPRTRAPYIYVEDSGGEENSLTPDQADTFADSLTAFADRIRALAQAARACGEKSEVQS